MTQQNHMSVKELNQLSNKILRELNAMQLEQAEKDYVLFWKILRDDDLVKERQPLFLYMELRTRFAIWDRAKRDSTILSWARSLEAASFGERVDRKRSVKLVRKIINIPMKLSIH